MAGRAEHHRVALGLPAEAVRGRVGVVIGLDLDDDRRPTPLNRSVAPIRSGATSCTLRAKKSRRRRGVGIGSDLFDGDGSHPISPARALLAVRVRAR